MTRETIPGAIPNAQDLTPAIPLTSWVTSATERCPICKSMVAGPDLPGHYEWHGSLRRPAETDWVTSLPPCERRFGTFDGRGEVCDRLYGHTGSHTREGVPYGGERSDIDDRRTEAVIRGRWT